MERNRTSIIRASEIQNGTGGRTAGEQKITNQALVLRKEDRHAGVDLADSERDKHLESEGEELRVRG